MKYQFANRVNNIKVSAIRQMPILASQYQNVISLGQGVPSFPTPKYITQAVAKALKENSSIGQYSLQPGVPELKQKISEKITGQYQITFNPETEILITVGAMEALAASILTLVNPGDEVIVFEPGYPSYREQIALAGGKVITVDLMLETWQIDFGDLKKKISSKTKAIIINNPANPTGKVFSRKELDSIAQIAQKNNLYIISDETYNFLVYDNQPYFSLLQNKKIRNRLITCFSFSKEYAMTGWRVGYMAAPAKIIEQVQKTKDALTICAPTISQLAALAALKQKPQNQFREILQNRRDLMCQRLDRLPDLFAYTKPPGAYYLLAKYLKTDLDSEAMAQKILQAVQVITIPGRSFGKITEGYLRLCFGATAKEINQAFDRLEQWNKLLI